MENVECHACTLNSSCTPVVNCVLLCPELTILFCYLNPPAADLTCPQNSATVLSSKAVSIKSTIHVPLARSTLTTLRPPTRPARAGIDDLNTVHPRPPLDCPTLNPSVVVVCGSAAALNPPESETRHPYPSLPFYPHLYRKAQALIYQSLKLRPCRFDLQIFADGESIENIAVSRRSKKSSRPIAPRLHYPFAVPEVRSRPVLNII